MRNKQVIEAAIFLSQEPVTPKELSEKLNIDRRKVENTLKELEKDYKGRGIELVEIGGGFRFQTSKEVYNRVKPFVEDKPVKLSRNLLEVLAIVAYNQPITKSQISAVRGKNSNGALKSLIEKGLIEEAGRANLPGRPKLYRTTKEFLVHFGLKSLNELPPVEVADEESDQDPRGRRTALRG